MSDKPWEDYAPASSAPSSSEGPWNDYAKKTGPAAERMAAAEANKIKRAPTVSEFFAGTPSSPEKDKSVAMSDDPNKDYGFFLPYAFNKEKRSIEFAAPEIVRGMVQSIDRTDQIASGKRPVEYGEGGMVLSPADRSAVLNVAGMGVGGALDVGRSSVGKIAQDTLASKLKSVEQISDYVAEQKGRKVVQEPAAQEIFRRLIQDQKGGGPTAQDMLDLHALTPNKELTLADLSGANVRGLAGKLARAPGESKAIMSGLEKRQKGAGEALTTDIQGNISGGGPVFPRIQALVKSRSEGSKPAYEAAGIPANPKDYPAAPLVESPEVTNIIKKSADVRRAIASAKRLPDYADLKDNSMVLLDKAYKNIGGMANEASRSGNGERARDLNNLRAQLLDAITGGDANHPYNKALQAFSGPSHSIDVVNLGKEHFNTKLSKEEKAALFNQLSDTDKELYRLGAADAKINAVRSRVDAADKSKAVINSDRDRDDFRILFDSPEAAKKFEDSIAAERIKNDTVADIFGNAKTASRVAEDGTPLQDAAVNTAQAGIAGVLGHPISAAQHGYNALMDIRRLSDPARNAEMARIMTAPLGGQGSPGMKLLADFAKVSPQTNNLMNKSVMGQR